MEEEVSLMDKDQEEIVPVSNKYSIKELLNVAFICFYRSWTLLVMRRLVRLQLFIIVCNFA